MHNPWFSDLVIIVIGYSTLKKIIFYFVRFGSKMGRCQPTHAWSFVQLANLSSRKLEPYCKVGRWCLVWPLMNTYFAFKMFWNIWYTRNSDQLEVQPLTTHLKDSRISTFAKDHIYAKFQWNTFLQIAFTCFAKNGLCTSLKHVLGTPPPFIIRPYKASSKYYASVHQTILKTFVTALDIFEDHLALHDISLVSSVINRYLISLVSRISCPLR